MMVVTFMFNLPLSHQKCWHQLKYQLLRERIWQKQKRNHDVHPFPHDNPQKSYPLIMSLKSHTTKNKYN